MDFTRVTVPLFRQALVVKKNSPHIFFSGGIVGFLGTVYLASKATLGLEEKVNAVQHELEYAETLPEEHKHEAVVRTYRKAAIDIGKMYAPAIVAGGLSVAALTGSHVQLTRRNTALASTLAVVSKAYDDYRQRVQDELGKEKELDLHHDLKDVHVTDKDGKIHVVKEMGPNGASMYARFFDEGSENWQKDSEYNKMFLMCQQNWANTRLRHHGHVFLNEVYDWLGLPRSKEGAVVGWVSNGDGDNYIDFGILEIRNADFINGYEPRILLDFNVDGVIYNLI